ncbi:MAG: chitobiase/beta-hexosaminidase C-terminal domain-containing protein, partial [Theionarchaea archaeon]|nr:chitobiase/beta-hexosaminidase C-terminal domain-containing protein [Theionarchaea archaeon]
FLGEQAGAPREYVYASRDRHDESYDMVRAVRDARFKYIRHYNPGEPYLIWVPYLNKHPIMQEMWRLYMEGELKGPQTLLFGPKPVEELYDTHNDPYEIENLAGDAEHRGELDRLRKALDDWIEHVGDMSRMSEFEMVRLWYPDGKKPRTAPPLFVPICEENPGRVAAPEGGSYRGPLLVQIHCATQGASVAYTLNEGEDTRWLLYAGAIRLPEGETTIRARAIRIGYAESEEKTAKFSVEKAIS